MNRREAEQARQLVREKALYQYSSALEHGDFEVVSAVLKEAERDPMLERMLLEVNEVYQAEMEGQQTRATPTPRRKTSTNAGHSPGCFGGRGSIERESNRW